MLQILVHTGLWYKGLPRTQKIIVTVVTLLVVVGVLAVAFSGKEEVEVTKTIKRSVHLASVASLSNIETNLPLVGTVTSVSEATLRAETSGRLTRVYKKLGDGISAGGIIAEFENSGERAAVLQAEGAYEQAKASREIALINNGQAGTSLNDTKRQSVNAIANAYISMDDAISGKTDAAFTDPKFDQVKLAISVPDANLASSLEIRRKAIEKILRAREKKNMTINESSDLVGELTIIQTEVETIKTYLDDLFTAYSKALPDQNFSETTLATGKANTQTARQAIGTLLSTLVTTRTTLTASISANQISGGATGGTGALASADAQIKQAQGAYNAALSRLEKTIIRSPITGTLNSLSINTGDYISAFTQVAVVSNNGALEVVSLVTEDDAKRITVGAPALINETISGVVTRIASAIDPTTKKIEVRIGIKDSKSSLINGQSVSITLTKNKKESGTQQAQSIVIPLSALKLTPRGANVFVMSSSSTLVAIPVKEGAILGEQIQILSGLTGSEQIVTDARGLKEGQEVTVLEH
jgi:multidrug resistance efflux pump